MPRNDILQEINSYMIDTWLTSSPVDGSLNNVPFMRYAYDKDCFRKEDYSAGLRKNNVFAEAQAVSTDSSGNNMTVQDSRANYDARVDWKTIPLALVIPRAVILSNKSTKEKVRGIFSYGLRGISTILNTINSQAWKDGTGNSGKDIDGFALAISKTPDVTAYANLDPAIITQWKNYAANASDSASGLPNAGQPLSADNILDVIDYVMSKLHINGVGIDTICVADYYYNMISKAMRVKQYISNVSDVAYLGFRSLNYNNAVIINVGGLQRSGVAPIGDKEMYFIAMSDLDIGYCNDGDSSQAAQWGIKGGQLNSLIYPEMADGLIVRKSPNNLDYVMNLVFEGNMLLGDRQRHGIVYEDPTSVNP